MAKMITIKEAVKRWNIGERRITTLCRDGRIPGAYKEKCWMIPEDAQKPEDKRVKTGEYRKTAQAEKLPLPIGVSDFKTAVSEYYYVDKTLLIRDFLDEKPKVSLFTRPRRFGKTLNLDMLKTFFEAGGEDTSGYFRDRKIWSCGQKYRENQGRYPVIFITFKDIKNRTWEDSFANISSVLSAEFLRHGELLESSSVNEYDKEYFRKVAAQKTDEVELGQGLLVLSRMLHEHYRVAPVILIDEYDTPIQQGYTAGFYDRAVMFMRNFFSGGLKDNPHLSYGFMTGILRVSKDSIFSGLNNLVINSVVDQKYSDYFGFTETEVKEMAAYYEAEEKYQEICEWYDGYRFGDTAIFNPWSVSHYFSRACTPGAYWQATGSNDLIGELLKEADGSVYENLHRLLQGKSVVACIDTNVIYPEIRERPSSIYSFLLAAGYLKAVRKDMAFTGDYMCELVIPNREITYVYQKEVLDRMSLLIPPSTVMELQVALYTGNSDSLQENLEKLLLQSASCCDTAK